MTPRKDYFLKGSLIGTLKRKATKSSLTFKQKIGEQSVYCAFKHLSLSESSLTPGFFGKQNIYLNYDEMKLCRRNKKITNDEMTMGMMGKLTNSDTVPYRGICQRLRKTLTGMERPGGSLSDSVRAL